MEETREDDMNRLLDVITKLERILEDCQIKPTDGLWDIGDVARYCGVSERTIEKEIAMGKLQPIYIGGGDTRKGLRRFTPGAIDGYLRTCTTRASKRRR